MYNFIHLTETWLLQYGCKCGFENVHWPCYLTLWLPDSTIPLFARNAKADLR
jgi:hypothetical protein